MSSTVPAINLRGMASNLRIGWVGTGVMGVSMCGHLLDKGHAVTVFNRTKAKAQPLLDKGATWAESPRAVAAQSDVVFTMVGFPQDVRDVYFGENGVLAGVKRGTVLVDMTTTAPSLAQEIAAAAKAKGAQAIDAPVSGGDVGARNATLSIMVGGDKDSLRCGAAIAADARQIHCSPRWRGCRPTCEALQPNSHCRHDDRRLRKPAVRLQSGLDLDTMLQSIRTGAAACWTLDNLAPRILKGNFDPGFFVDHFVKDMGLALEEARRMNLTLPGLELVHNLYRRVQALGHGQKGTHALMLALAEMSNVQFTGGAAADRR